MAASGNLGHLVRRKFPRGWHGLDTAPSESRSNPAPGLPTQLALSVRQPWAWLIVHGGKDVENRTWATKVRGRVMIHASLGLTVYEYAHCAVFARRNGVQIPAFRNLYRGGIIGSVEIVNCLDLGSSMIVSKWFEGPYGFELRSPEPVEFIPCRGALGFWKWPSNAPGEAPRTGGTT